jgi:hypothetical protein
VAALSWIKSLGGACARGQGSSEQSGPFVSKQIFNAHVKVNLTVFGAAMSYPVIILAACILLPLAYFYLRFRVTPSWHRGIDYYTNFIFVYERDFTSYGWISLDLPDLFPFLRDSIVWGADPFSFRLVGDFNSNPGISSTANQIFRDRWHVIYQGKVIWDSDPNSLELFEGYAKDKVHVYFDGFVSSKLDPQSFEMLGCEFWRDKNGVYYLFTGREVPLEMVDKDTFEVRNPGECHSEVPYTARDKNHLYKADGVRGFRIIK